MLATLGVSAGQENSAKYGVLATLGVSAGQENSAKYGVLATRGVLAGQENSAKYGVLATRGVLAGQENSAKRVSQGENTSTYRLFGQEMSERERKVLCGILPQLGISQCSDMTCYG